MILKLGYHHFFTLMNTPSTKHSISIGRSFENYFKINYSLKAWKMLNKIFFGDIVCGIN
jgi:hypothetical protein